MSVLVTGAGGAVGRQVVKHLLEIKYLDSIVCADLSLTQIYKALRSIGVSPTHPKLKFEQLALPEGVKHLSIKTESYNPINYIIHTAACVDITAPSCVQMAVNFEGTRALVDKFKDCNGFCFISSGSIYKPGNNIKTEVSEVHAGNAYEKSKLLAESTVKSRLDSSQRVVLRPALIYGPGSRFLGATLAALGSMLSFPGSPRLEGGPRTNWVHAEDVARAAIHTIFEMGLRGQTYNVADECAYGFGDTATEYINEISQWQSGIQIPLPNQLILNLLKPIIGSPITLDGADWALKKAWKIFCKRENIKPLIQPAVGQELADFIFSDTIFSAEKLLDTLFELKHPDHHKAIKETIQWYREQKWI